LVASMGWPRWSSLQASIVVTLDNSCVNSTTWLEVIAKARWVHTISRSSGGRAKTPLESACVVKVCLFMLGGYWRPGSVFDADRGILGWNWRSIVRKVRVWETGLKTTDEN
jgi:hypothetical protein